MSMEEPEVQCGRERGDEITEKSMPLQTITGGSVQELKMRAFVARSERYQG